MTVAINGIAHIYLTVADYERAFPFYRRLQALCDMQCLMDTDNLYYCVGARLEVNHVPGRGNLADDVELPLAGVTQARLSEP